VLTATYGAWQMRTGARNMRAIYVMVGLICVAFAAAMLT